MTRSRNRHRRPVPAARVTSKSPAERLTGVADDATVEIFSTTFSEYFEPVGYGVAQESLAGEL